MAAPMGLKMLPRSLQRKALPLGTYCMTRCNYLEIQVYSNFPGGLLSQIFDLARNGGSPAGHLFFRRRSQVSYEIAVFKETIEDAKRGIPLHLCHVWSNTLSRRICYRLSSQSLVRKGVQEMVKSFCKRWWNLFEQAGLNHKFDK